MPSWWCKQMRAEEEDGRKGSSFFLWRRGSVGKRRLDRRVFRMIVLGWLRGIIFSDVIAVSNSLT